MTVHGILGIMIVQFSYFKGIAAGDAAATTVICSTSPALMILYLAARRRRLPHMAELLTVAAAVGALHAPFF